MYEDVDTRQDRRQQARAKETIDSAAKRYITHRRMVRNHLEEQGIEFSEKMVTGKAFIEALNWKHRRRSPSRADMKLAGELQATTKRYLHLASTVTRFISRECSGFMWGDSLDDLYEEIAEAPYVLQADSAVTAADVKFAVDIAVGKKWLRCQEAADADAPVRTCIDTYAA